MAKNNYTATNYKATNYTATNYTVYSFSLLFYFIIAYMLIDSSGYGKGRSRSSSSVLTRIILYWMVFGVFIGLFELVLFFKHRYIASLPLVKQNFWYRVTPIHSILETTFWSKGWREYGDFCDSRYTTQMNIVHYIELIHAISAFIYIYILYYFFRYNTIHTSFIGKLMVSIASIHLLFTFIYFITFYLHLTENPIKQGMKFWSYLLLNVLWIIMPLLVLGKGIMILRNKK